MGEPIENPKTRKPNLATFGQIIYYILVGCAQTAAVLDESMIGGMGDCWDFIIGWLID